MTFADTKKTKKQLFKKLDELAELKIKQGILIKTLILSIDQKLNNKEYSMKEARADARELFDSFEK